MDPGNVINLFDSLWFKHEILKKNPNDSWVKTHKSEVRFSSLRSILVRSQSEDIGSSFNYGSFSPNSVLKSIPSGKLDFKTQKQKQEQEQDTTIQTNRHTYPVKSHKAGFGEDEMRANLTSIRRDKDAASRKTHGSEPETTMVNRIEKRERKKNKKRRCGMSKSLSDLEFEELKGFTDMGFVFSEQDKDSSLVKIIPGLQRLGEEGEREDDEDENDDDGDGDGDERRPYLSEAWDDLDRKTKKERKEPPPPVMKWEIPAVRDEIDMKDNLKLWAHTVASFVR